MCDKVSFFGDSSFLYSRDILWDVLDGRWEHRQVVSSAAPTSLLVLQWVVGSPPSFYQTSTCLLVKQWVVGSPPPANKGGGNVAVYPPVATYRSHATEEQV